MNSTNAIPRFLLALLLALLLTACGGGASGSSDLPPTDLGDGSGDTVPVDDDPLPGDTREEEVLILVNQVRAEYDLAPVQWHEGAAAVALAHSKDMRDRDFFDHVNPDGLDAGDRLTAAGVEFSGWGENIARGYLTPESVMEGWMNSPGHRANILSEHWTHLGIGVTAPVTPGPWWTQNFLRVP